MSINLQSKNNDLSVTGRRSPTPSEIALARELDRTAQNAKIEMSEDLTQEFLERYSHLGPEQIVWMFRTHRGRSNYWPTIKEIEDLRFEWTTKDARRRDDVRLFLEKEKTRRRLATGEKQFGLGDMPSIYKELFAKRGMDTDGQETIMANVQSVVRQRH